MTDVVDTHERVARLAGELDILRRDEVKALVAATDDGLPLVVDLAAVDFADHQTVAILLGRRGPTELRNPPPSVRRIRAALGI